MCITYFQVFNNDHPLKYFVAFNREEHIDREAVTLSFLDKYPNIICSVDKKTGTTWLAFNKKTGDLAFLTIYRTKKNETKGDF